MKTELPTRRHWIKKLSLVLAGIFAVLLIACLCCYVWLWSWTWKAAPEFHENWASDERSALTAFDDRLYQIFTDSLDAVGPDSDLIDILCGVHPLRRFWNSLQNVVGMRGACADIREQLYHFARSGHAGDERMVYIHLNNQRLGTSPTILAAASSHLRAVEALVAHGSNPNMLALIEEEYYEPMELETPLTPIINGIFNDGSEIPWEERRKTADFLIAHGADINGTQRIIGLACDIPLMLKQPADPRPWMWALDHGKTVSAENMKTIVTTPAAEELLERILREKKADLNAVDDGTTLLQSFLTWVGEYRDNKDRAESIQKLQVEKRLDMLLAAGIDPNFVPAPPEPRRPDESEEDYEERTENFTCFSRFTPLETITYYHERAVEPWLRELCLRLIDKLRSAGAR